MAKFKLFYNGTDKFKKRACELLNDETLENEVKLLREQIADLNRLVFGIFCLGDMDGNSIITDERDNIVICSGTAENLATRVEALEEAVFNG